MKIRMSKKDIFAIRVFVAVIVFGAFILRMNSVPGQQNELEPEIEITVEVQTMIKESEPEIETTVEELAVNIPILKSVPLSRELQEWIYTYATEQNVSPYLVYAVIWQESNFKKDATGDSGQSHGLMQIRVQYHQERMNSLGVTDLYDPKQNIMVGIDYLVELLTWRETSTLEWVLMAYNGGPDYADKLQASGKVSTYALEVLRKLHDLKEGA